MRVLVVAPTYEEAENIEQFLHLVRAAVPAADVLVVDDNSPDGTGRIAERVAAELGQIEVLHRPGKGGLGTAYRAGFSVGVERGYDTLVQIDSDLSHDPAVVPELLQQLDRGADVAIGSRYVPGGSIPHWSWHRRALSRYGNLYACRMLGMRISDTTSGFRAYRADTLKAVDFASTRARRGTGSRSSSRTACSAGTEPSSNRRSASPTACAAVRRCRGRSRSRSSGW